MANCIFDFCLSLNISRGDAIILLAVTVFLFPYPFLNNYLVAARIVKIEMKSFEVSSTYTCICHLISLC